MDYIASKILSREKIRYLAKIYRKLFDIKELKINIFELLEKVVSTYSDNLYYVVEEDELFEKEVMAYIEQEKKDLFCIHLRESVYLGAIL